MPYFCHNCNHQIVEGVNELECPKCESGFIEEVSLEELALRASTLSATESDTVRPPIPPIRQQLVQNPVDLQPSSHRTRVSQVYDPFRDFQAEAQWVEHMNNQREGETSGTESNQKRTLQDLFRPPIDIVFRGSFTAARDDGVAKNKWLLVNIQNSKEFACQTLNRDVWSHQTIKDILKEHFVFWQVYHESPEGRRYVQNYRVRAYPYVAIVDPRTGEELRAWPTSIDHNSFCDSVIEFLAENQLPEQQKSSETKNSTNNKPATTDTSSIKKHCVSPTLYDQSEEEQLEAAIKASLQENMNLHDDDTSRDDILQEDDDNDLDEDDNNEVEDDNELNGRVEEDVDDNGLIEDYKDHSDPNDTSENQQTPKVKLENYMNYVGQDDKCSDLIIRFPDGSRETLKLPCDSKMKALFLLLSSRGYDFENYNYLTTFPRRYLNESPEMDSLANTKLMKETIYVEKKSRD